MRGKHGPLLPMWPKHRRLDSRAPEIIQPKREIMGDFLSCTASL